MPRQAVTLSCLLTTEASSGSLNVEDEARGEPHDRRQLERAPWREDAVDPVERHGKGDLAVLACDLGPRRLS